MLVANSIGGKAAMFVKAFVAGASEDRAFLREALGPLCRAIHVRVEPALDLFGAMQYSGPAAVSLALRALGASDDARKPSS